MKVTVCELPNDPGGLAEQWDHLTDHTRSAKSDLVLLPEMPFHPWPASSARVNPERWRQTVESHRRWIERLTELGAAVVMGTRPVNRNGVPHNEGFVWTTDMADRSMILRHRGFCLTTLPPHPFRISV